MSRNSVVLGRSGVNSVPPRTEHPPLESLFRSGEYLYLIQRLFSMPSVVAIGGSGSGEAVRKICDDIAAEMASAGKRVVVVPSATVSGLSSLEAADDTAFVPGRAPNTWILPASTGRQFEFPRLRQRADQENWVGGLRRNFDAALLECGGLGATPGVAEVMALADAAVLVVEAGRTSKHRVQRDQRALELKGAKLAGCVLIRQR
jgi:hypothetical protein